MLSGFLRGPCEDLGTFRVSSPGGGSAPVAPLAMRGHSSSFALAPLLVPLLLLACNHLVSVSASIKIKAVYSPLGNDQDIWFVNVSVGTPPQRLPVQVDTGMKPWSLHDPPRAAVT